MGYALLPRQHRHKPYSTLVRWTAERHCHFQFQNPSDRYPILCLQKSLQIINEGYVGHCFDKASVISVPKNCISSRRRWNGVRSYSRLYRRRCRRKTPTHTTCVEHAGTRLIPTQYTDACASISWHVPHPPSSKFSGVLFLDFIQHRHPGSTTAPPTHRINTFHSTRCMYI
jgi:hypothetical protein